MFKKVIASQIQTSIDVKQLILSDELFLLDIQKAADIITRAYQNNKKTLLAGNILLANLLAAFILTVQAYPRLH